MKYCTKCGGEINNFATECSHCGQKFASGDNKINEEPWKNPYNSSNMNTDNYNMPDMEVGNYSFSSNTNYGINNSEKSRRSNKIAFIIGIAFLIILAVSSIFIIKAIKGQNHKEEETVMSNWLDAMIELDVDKFIDNTFCEPILKAVIKKYNISEYKYRTNVSEQLASSQMSSIQYKNLRIKRKTAVKQDDVDKINAEIEKYSGESNVISAMYDVKIEYQIKSRYETSWSRNSEEVTLYVSNGKYYIYSPLM